MFKKRPKFLFFKRETKYFNRLKFIEIVITRLNKIISSNENIKKTSMNVRKSRINVKMHRINIKHLKNHLNYLHHFNQLNKNYLNHRLIQIYQARL